jgi:hypothetical protein
MKKKKTFQSESLRRLVLLERLVWLIPIDFFLWNLWVFRELFGRMMESEHPIAAGIIIVGVCATAAFVRGVVPFLVLKLKALLYCAKKQMIQNNTFQTVSDFEYYRDKLEGLSPGAISLISDLKIQQKKDVAASILKYKEMGVLKEIDGRYVAENLEQAQLRESDTRVYRKCYISYIRKKRQVIGMRLAFFALLLSRRVRSFFLASQTCSF